MSQHDEIQDLRKQLETQKQLHSDAAVARSDMRDLVQTLTEQRDKAQEEAAMWRMHIKTCLGYPRGSEAQVRCLEEVGGDAAYMDKKHKKSKT